MSRFRKEDHSVISDKLFLPAILPYYGPICGERMVASAVRSVVMAVHLENYAENITDIVDSRYENLVFGIISARHAKYRYTYSIIVGNGSLLHFLYSGPQEADAFPMPSFSLLGRVTLGRDLGFQMRVVPLEGSTSRYRFPV